MDIKVTSGYIRITNPNDADIITDYLRPVSPSPSIKVKDGIVRFQVNPFEYHTCDIADLTLNGVAVVGTTDNAVREEIIALFPDAGGSAGTTLDDIDVFTIGGQSNAQGQSPDATLSPAIPAGIAYQYYGGVLTELTGDPVGNASLGSAWPAFAIKWNQLTGRKICFVPTAIPSTSQVAAADPGGGTWDTSGTLFDDSVTATNNALTELSTNYNPAFRGILWCQGEADAGAITATTITKAQYKTALQTMIANYRTEFGVHLPFFIFRTGGADTVGRTDIMAAQAEVADSDYYTNLVFINAVDFPTRSLQSGAHYLQIAYNEMGDVGATNSFNWYSNYPIAIQYNKVGIGTLLPTDTLHVLGTTKLEGAVNATSTLGVSGVATFSDNIANNATTLTKDIGATANVWRIGYFGTINSGTGNALVLRSANTNQPVKFQNGATEAGQFALTTGFLLLGTTSDDTVNRLQVNGSVKSTQFRLSALNTAPASASATGTAGEIRIDASFIYVCTATNTWKRVAIATW